MGALYEDVENFFGDIFAWYGRIVSRYPLVFIFVPLMTCSALGLGLFKLQYETNLENLYTPISSKASTDRAHLNTLFPDTSAQHFYGHQSINMPAYGEIIVMVPLTTDYEYDDDYDDDDNDNNDDVEKEYEAEKTQETALSERNTDEYVYLSNVGKSIENIELNPVINAQSHQIRISNTSTNVLTADILNETRRLCKSLWALTSRAKIVTTIHYADVCARRNGSCVVDGAQIVYRNWTHGCVRDEGLDYSGILAGLDKDNITGCLTATALKIRFNLNTNSSKALVNSISWQGEFIEKLKEYHSNVINISFVASHSLQIELRDHVGEDTKFFSVSIVAMIALATLCGSGLNCIGNHVTLAYAGVMAALLAILGAFGLLSLIGLRFVNLCSVMPFLVLGIGTDDMFQLLAEWRRSNMRASTEERMASTLRSAAVSVTITSLTDLLAFCIGATSPFLSVRNFCACSGAAIFLCYVNQLTFFSGCLVMHSRRINSSRHCLTCHITRSSEEMTRDGVPPLAMMLCSGHQPKWQDDEEGLYKKIQNCFNVRYPKALLHWTGKCVAIILFILYLAVSIWGVTHLEEGFTLETLVPPEEYYREHVQRDRDQFPDYGASVMMVVKQPIEYHKRKVSNELINSLEMIEASPDVLNGSSVSWLAAYRQYLEDGNQSWISNKPAMLKKVESFLQIYPQYRGDVVMDSKQILASRFYVICKKVNSSDDEGELMLRMRELGTNSSTAMIAFSPDFVFYEHYVAIMKNTLLPVGVTMIGMLFVALVFIPHPIAVTCVTVSMSSVVLGMMGLMHTWSLALSAIATIQIILGVGICVSFTVHTTHAFMTATGKTRNERVTAALVKVGVFILNGALSSILSIAALSLGTSFIFVSCFKTMLLAFLLGALHSIVFLPVMLSFIGPRRTSKPRMYVPVSPSVRSLQDSYSIPNNSTSAPATPNPAGNTSPRNLDDFPGLDQHSLEETPAGATGGCSTATTSIADDDSNSSGATNRSDNGPPGLVRKVSFRIDNDRPGREGEGGREDLGGVKCVVVECNGTGSNGLTGSKSVLERRKSQDVETQTVGNCSRLFDTIEEIMEESDV